MKMKKEVKGYLMKKAHEMAKTMEGDYSARLSLALKRIWEQYKKAEEIVAKGWKAKFSHVKVWKKDFAHRVYLTGELGFPKSFNPLFATYCKAEFEAYYDVAREKVVVTKCIRSLETVIEEYVSERATDELKKVA